MDYTPEVAFESKVDTQTRYTLLKMSHARRIDLNRKAASAVTRLTEIESEMVSIQADITRAQEAAKIEPCTCGHPIGDGDHDPVSGQCKVAGCNCREPRPDEALGGYAKMMELQYQRQVITIEELYPAYIRVFVAKIDGLSINGKPATTESLLSDGPEPLVGELGRRIQVIIHMSPEEVLGFKLPSTSGAPLEGQTSSTNAPIASA